MSDDFLTCSEVKRKTVATVTAIGPELDADPVATRRPGGRHHVATVTADAGNRRRRALIFIDLGSTR